MPFCQKGQFLINFLINGQKGCQGGQVGGYQPPHPWAKGRPNPSPSLTSLGGGGRARGSSNTSFFFGPVPHRTEFEEVISKGDNEEGMGGGSAKSFFFVSA